MKTEKKILLFAIFITVGMLNVGQAVADESAVPPIKESAPSTAEAAENAAPKQTKNDKATSSGQNAKTDASGSTTSQTQSDKASTPTKQTAAFIDRDGDGIRDGKEHRFRRRSSHRNSGSESRQMKMRRSQSSKNEGGSGKP